MYVNIRSHVALREREVNLVEKLWKLKLIKRSPTLRLLVAYYKISNAILKQPMKVKAQLTALLWRVHKKRH